MIANSQMEPEINERLCKTQLFWYILMKEITFKDMHFIFSPLEKMISSDRLSFIPNLYYQQYRLLDVLAESRSDYPQQKILVPRQETNHDYLMLQMRKNHFLLEQEIKFRKAICFHLAKTAKEEFFKKRIKKQEKYLFHRIAYSQLAQAVKNKFEECKSDPKINQIKDQNQNNKKKVKPKINEDIFMQRQESEPNILPQDDDLLGLGQIFDKPKVQEPQQKEQVIKLNTIQDYIIQQYSNDNRQKECKKVLNRKSCLKRINQNIRKRIKSKSNEDLGQKNLNSATVLITALISNQGDNKNQMANQHLMIQTPFENEFLSNVQTKQKRKRQQNFQLKWDKDTMQQFEQMNTKFQINKSKFDSNYLTTNIVKDQKQYERVFLKNIMSKQKFPPSINSIPSLDEKFKVNPYYNTSTDRQYEKFIMKHNKKAIFQKFKQISNLTLVDTYINDEQSTNISKIFLNPQGTFSDRVIYKVNNNKLVPISAVHQKISLSKQQLLILSFLVRKYMGIFGSNWKIITMLILTDPNFANMYLNTDQIQQLFQIVKSRQNETSLQQINLMNKKILPSSIFINTSYEVMQPQLKMSPIYDEMTDQSEQINKKSEQINIDNYQNLLNQPLEQHEVPKQYAFQNTSKAYEEYVKSVKLPMLHQYTLNITQNLSSVINEFESKTQTKFVEHKQPVKINQCSDWVLDKVKNQIKFSTPVRKRKYVTDKLSELVKILHTLKQKQQPAARPSMQVARAPVPASAPTDASNAKPVTTNSVTPTPPAATQAPIKKTLPKATKPEEKKDKDTTKDKSAPKEPKDRKKKGGKDGDKDQQSK